MVEQQREIRIPEDLCVRAEEKFGRRFSSAEELICFILRELLNDDALQADRVEESIVEKRLRELGYL